MIEQEQKTNTTREQGRQLTGVMLICAMIVVVMIALTSAIVHGVFPGTAAIFAPPAHFTYRGHGGPVSSVAWSPDGKRIASASSDGTVQVWDAYTGANTLVYRGHTGGVLSVAWSPNGREIASGGLDGMVQVWNAATGQTITVYRDHSAAVYSVAWSPDGQRIASASADGTVQVWNAATGQFAYRFGPQLLDGILAPWYAAAWSPDGQRIAAGAQGRVVVFDAATGQNTTFHGPQTGIVHDLAWSPGGQYLAVAVNSDAQVWDVASSQNIYTFHYVGHTQYLFALAWSPNGKRIAIGAGDGMAEVFDALTGQHLSQYHGHYDLYNDHTIYNASVNTLAWSPDGSHIASGSGDDTVQVWPAP